MNPMRKSFLAIIAVELCVFFLPSASCGGETNAASPELDRSTSAVSLVMLSVSTSSNIVEQGQQLDLVVLLENTSSREVSFIHAHEFYACELVVTNGSGQEVPRTSFGKAGGPQFASPSVIVSTVEPGGQRVWRIPVSLLYDMTVPGQYWVKARKRVELSGKGQQPTALYLESEALEVLIVRKPDSSQAKFRRKQT